MGKGSKRQRKAAGNNAKTQPRGDIFREEDIDDEIDAFHKQRDVIPLGVDDEVGDSDDDMEQPVFDFEGGDDDDSDNKSGGDDDIDDEDDDISDDIQPKGFAAKIARQAKYLQQKFGGGDDEMSDDEEQEEERKALWGRRKNSYYGADNVDYELQSSDEELPIEEEAEALRIRRENVKSLSMEDFGLEDADQVDNDSDGQEKASQDGFAGKKAVAKLSIDAVHEDSRFESYEEVQKDLSALSKEEQMDVVYSSAPELVGLLTELNVALHQLKKLKPLLPEVVSERKDTPKGGMNYLEVKPILLLTYCQAISFYLLLKSEGHAVRDHPVIARLVEIKNLMEKMKQIDASFPSQIEEIGHHMSDTGHKLVGESDPVEFQPDKTNASSRQNEEANGKAQLVNDESSKDFSGKTASKKKQDVEVGSQSLEMLKIRANLEAKLKQKGLYNFSNPKPEITLNHPTKPVNRNLGTLDDFDDEVKQTTKRRFTDNGHAVPQLVASKKYKPKFVSGDDDLPKRDDIGERRRKHELQVLARAGAKSVGDDTDTNDEDGPGTRSMDVDFQEEDEEAPESEDELYKQVKKQRVEKLIAKEHLYSRTPAAPSLETTEADGKRQITYQMEKNRGLTRSRKKLTKIPRKKYKIKHQKAVIRRKGQVRDIRKPTGPYGGEATGVNINVSRSVRFKN